MSTERRTVTTAGEWAQAAHEETAPLLTGLLTLPSGAVVEVCRADLSVWLGSGARRERVTSLEKKRITVSFDA